ncbi:MAG: hypothetical protein GXW85_05120 [Clostridia bacterium]|nr:hypothetical protein [Clostridia bacterium]
MKKIYFFSMYFLFVLVLTNEFFAINTKVFIFLSSLGMVAFLASSLYKNKGFQLYVSLISLAVGHFLLYKYHLGFDVWYESLMKGLGMPVLFVVIPLISFPIKYGDYLGAIESFVKTKSKKPGFLFSFLAVTHLVLSIALDIGSIPVLQNILKQVKFPKKFLALLYAAGYSSFIAFSPYNPLVIMVLLFSSVTYSEYFFTGLAMVALIILVTTVLVKADKKLLEEFQTNLSFSGQNNRSHKKAYELLVNIFFLIGLASICGKILPLSNVLYTITIIIVVYSMVWGLLLKVLDKYKSEFRGYSENFLSFKGFLPFLISANFLGSIVSFTPIKESIEDMVLILNHLPTYFVILFFIVLTMLLSAIGVHMMITVTTYAMTITPGLIGLSNTAFAVTLLTCWFMAMLISPFVPYNMVVAETIDEKPLNIVLKYNLKFCLVMLVFAPLLILGLNYLS